METEEIIWGRDYFKYAPSLDLDDQILQAYFYTTSTWCNERDVWKKCVQTLRLNEPKLMVRMIMLVCSTYPQQQDPISWIAY